MMSATIFILSASTMLSLNHFKTDQYPLPLHQSLTG